MVFVGAGTSLITPDGRVDTQFGTNGVVETQKIPTADGTIAAFTADVQPDGNILLAGGTARYENLKPVYPGGSMTVVNKTA